MLADVSARRMMIVDEGGGRGGGERGGGRRRGVPWTMLLLALAAVASSSLSALSLYHVLALQAEVEGLRLEAGRRREEHWVAPGEAQRQDPSQVGETWTQTEQARQFGAMSETVTDKPQGHAKRSIGEGQAVLQPCLQMFADNKRATFQKEFALEMHTGIPWQTGLRRGTALELHEDIIQVNEEGLFFVYSQVCYSDTRYVMGHIIIRMKKHVVGDECQHVVLFRCIKNMNTSTNKNHVVPFNTCYTGGIVKLEVGDKVELLIPRASANVSLGGDFTFLGAIKLA